MSTSYISRPYASSYVTLGRVVAALVAAARHRVSAPDDAPAPPPRESTETQAWVATQHTAAVSGMRFVPTVAPRRGA